jgi:hypothetical protein
MSCSPDYSLTYSQHRLVCANVQIARDSRCYQNRKNSASSLVGVVTVCSVAENSPCHVSTDSYDCNS